MSVWAVLCGTPPSVDNAFLIGRKRSHYDIHSVVRYQCADGFLQRHVPTAKCRANGKWDRPKIICTKSRRSHRYRRHHHKARRERRKHKKHGAGGHRGGVEAGFIHLVNDKGTERKRGETGLHLYTSAILVLAKAVDPIQAEFFVREAQVADARLWAPAAGPWVDDGVADAAILQPASLTAVQQLDLPGGIQLAHFGHCGAIPLTRLHCLTEEIRAHHLPLPTPTTTLTIKVGGEAEGIIALVLFVPVTVVANTSRGVLTAALVPGVRDRPPCIAPVQAIQPGLVQLPMGGQDGILLLAHILGLVVVQFVAPHTGVVWEHHTWRETTTVVLQRDVVDDDRGVPGPGLLQLHTAACHKHILELQGVCDLGPLDADAGRVGVLGLVVVAAGQGDGATTLGESMVLLQQMETLIHPGLILSCQWDVHKDAAAGGEDKA
ncbi:hypothetical protein JZ751_024522 [Albula glossodonta]|uniref:Sushi domain-containing protein n=1 Tax=Albula glossodonta TaxID=121402 RepID=A0A8T2PB78_9TELE|nr:hypothetical protein JZ751_024522 [Albula glossodonta]